MKLLECCLPGTLIKAFTSCLALGWTPLRPERGGRVFSLAGPSVTGPQANLGLIVDTIKSYLWAAHS